METKTIVMCAVALLLGILIADMLQNVCGCKDIVEGMSPCMNAQCDEDGTVDAGMCLVDRVAWQSDDTNAVQYIGNCNTKTGPECRCFEQHPAQRCTELQQAVALRCCDNPAKCKKVDTNTVLAGCLDQSDIPVFIDNGFGICGTVGPDDDDENALPVFNFGQNALPDCDPTTDPEGCLPVVVLAPSPGEGQNALPDCDPITDPEGCLPVVTLNIDTTEAEVLLHEGTCESWSGSWTIDQCDTGTVLSGWHGGCDPTSDPVRWAGCQQVCCKESSKYGQCSEGYKTETGHKRGVPGQQTAGECRTGYHPAPDGQCKLTWAYEGVDDAEGVKHLRAPGSHYQCEDYQEECCIAGMHIERTPPSGGLPLHDPSLPMVHIECSDDQIAEWEKCNKELCECDWPSTNEKLAGCTINGKKAVTTCENLRTRHLAPAPVPVPPPDLSLLLLPEQPSTTMTPPPPGAAAPATCPIPSGRVKLFFQDSQAFIDLSTVEPLVPL
jgi:hypothetical protein